MPSPHWRARAVAALLLCACGTQDPPERRELLARRDAGRLVGAWDVTFVADTSATVFRLRRVQAVVAGTIVFALNHGGRYSTSSLGAITHEGVYDVDFTPLGFTTRPSDAPADAVAHLGHQVSGAEAARPADSLSIVLSPGSDQFPVRMEGIFTGDAASGSWTAAARHAGGGWGRFTMRRRPAS